MKKLLLTAYCLLLTTALMGCATYKFHHGKAQHDKGYVVSRDNYTILEYTLGKNNSVPDLKLAQKRFKERRKVVEHYYKTMGYIENHFKMAFWDPAVFFLKIVGGVFRLPGIAISDYKARHNPEYREKIRRLQEEEDNREEARIQRLKDELNIYIQRRLISEEAKHN